MTETNNNRGIAIVVVVLLFMAGAFGFNLFQQELATRKVASTVPPMPGRAEVLTDDDLAQIKSMSQKVYRSCLKEADNPARSKAEKESIMAGICTPMLKKYQTQYGEEP